MSLLFLVKSVSLPVMPRNTRACTMGLSVVHVNVPKRATMIRNVAFGGCVLRVYKKKIVFFQRSTELKNAGVAKSYE